MRILSARVQHKTKDFLQSKQGQMVDKSRLVGSLNSSLMINCTICAMPTSIFTLYTLKSSNEHWKAIDSWEQNHFFNGQIKMILIRYYIIS